MNIVTKSTIILLAMVAVSLVVVGLVFASGNGRQQERGTKVTTPAPPADQTVKASVTGVNVLQVARKNGPATSPGSTTAGRSHALQVITAVIDGREQPEMKGWVLQYRQTVKGRELIRKHDGETLIVTGILDPGKRVLEVSSFARAAVPAPNAAPAAEAGELTWGTSLPTALAEAKTRQTRVVVDFYADWCVWCKRMDRDTLSDARVKARLRDFVLLRIDTDRQQDVAERFSINGLPTTVILNAQGETVARQDGYMQPDEYLKLLDGGK